MKKLSLKESEAIDNFIESKNTLFKVLKRISDDESGIIPFSATKIKNCFVKNDILYCLDKNNIPTKLGDKCDNCFVEQYTISYYEDIGHDYYGTVYFKSAIKGEYFAFDFSC